jgi:hypothetical protein
MSLTIADVDDIERRLAVRTNSRDGMLDHISRQKRRIAELESDEAHIDRALAKLDQLRVDVPAFAVFADEIEYALTGVRP